jgi:hypothetical protein
VVSEVEVPRPQPGEVLVEVASASVNGFDLSVAAGHVLGMMEHRFPLVLGKDFAGTITELGAGVAPGPASPRPPAERTRTVPGLASFQPEDAGWFFGREGMITRLVGRLGELHTRGGPRAARAVGWDLPDAPPDLWQRYLAIIFDGLRPEGVRPLPQPPPA